MSFLDKLEEIQNRPEPERKKIMAISLVVGMVLITAIWLVNFRYSIKTAEKTEEENKVPEPLSLIFSGAKNSAAELKNNVKEEWKKLKNIFSAESTAENFEKKETGQRIKPGIIIYERER
ncbi:MAG: hypothetical protein AAB564_01145 [Patescibacteria group bacterium]